MTALEFTGERFTPECVREIWYEHFHRYVFASVFSKNKRVLDAACGEGYGSALLAKRAMEVFGVDLSKDAIAHARDRYGSDARLHFETADAIELPYAEHQFDLVTSFETIEHLHEQSQLIASFRRVLKPDGILIISSPDKKTYSDDTGFHNEHHVKELYREEFLAVLKTQFPAVRLFGQKLLFQSVIWSLENTGGYSIHTAHEQSTRVEKGFGYAPLYFVAVCAASEDILDANVPLALSLFGDAEESVYKHYEHEIRKNMAAGARLLELEARIRELETLLSDAQARPTLSSPTSSETEISAASPEHQSALDPVSKVGKPNWLSRFGLKK